MELNLKNKTLHGYVHCNDKLYFKIDGEVFEISFDKPYLLKTSDSVELIDCHFGIDLYEHLGETIIYYGNDQVLYAYDDQIGLRDTVIWHPEILDIEYGERRKEIFKKLAEELKPYSYELEIIKLAIVHMIG